MTKRLELKIVKLTKQADSLVDRVLGNLRNDSYRSETKLKIELIQTLGKSTIFTELVDLNSFSL